MTNTIGSQVNYLSTPAQSKVEERGYAARISQLGPTLGTALATGEVLSDTASAVYEAAKKAPGETYSALSQAAHKVDQWATAAKDGLNAVETSVHDGVDAMEQGLAKIGHEISDATSSVKDGLAKGYAEVSQAVGSLFEAKA